MKPQELEYALEDLCLSIRVDPNVDGWGDYTVTAFKRFALSRQHTIEIERRTEYSSPVMIPFRVVDYLLHALSIWCPSLSFGWLKPQYIETRSRVDTHVTNHIYNVIPIDPNAHKRDSRFRVLMSHYSYGDDVRRMNDPIDEVRWLESTPANTAEILGIPRLEQAYMMHRRDCTL